MKATDGRLRSLVLEDEWPARNYLVELLEASGDAQVVCAVPSPALATAAVAAAPDPIDVAFVDVSLAGERDAERAGLTWIESLAGRTQAPRIVVTTASRDHALRAFELGVTDYLLKPFTLARVKDTLERLRATSLPRRPGRGAPGGEGRIVARKGKSLVFLAQRDAWAFEAEGRLCYVHTASGRMDVDLSLSALEAVLGDGYLRVHRNWLVATGRVRSLDREAGESSVLVGDNERELRIPVARERAAEVRDHLLAAAVGLRRDE